MMLEALQEPHREMAVDVPDSFVARSKTPPRYPPPRPSSTAPTAALAPPIHSQPQPTARLQPGQQATPTYANLTSPVTNGSVAVGGGKPVPPPRDHLRIESDGRLVNRAPPPQLPARTPVPVPVPAVAPSAVSVPVPAPTSVPAPAVATVVTAHEDPTQEQLDSIRKFQEALRRRREEEERLAAEAAFLNRSIRGSRKLQTLESHPLPSGVVNDGYSSPDEELQPHDAPALPLDDREEHLRRVVGYGELVASLQRLQMQLRRASASVSSTGAVAAPSAVLSPLEAQLAAVHALLLSPQFGRAIAVHNALQAARRRGLSRRPSPPPPGLPPPPATPPTAAAAASQPPLLQPACADAQALVRDCLDALQPCSLAAAAELADLLTRYEVEGLLLAHDAIAAASSSSSLPPPSPSAPSPAQPPAPSPAQPPLHPDDNIRIIKIEKTNEPLGATVRNEGESVVIGRVVRGGAADKSGLLREGDEVLEVNGVEMRGRSVNEVCDLLAAMTGTLTFLIAPAPRSTAHPPPRHAATHRDTLLHMKAHFDYDPEEDVYIPCRELGISFQKGDVLHVISQEDPNWWQAFREGEEEQTLAGLVPSRAFQHQRESMKQTIAGDRLSKEKSKKGGTLLCAKKNAKKKKKKAAHTDGGYPFYATSAIDDYDTEEILTYEEVALYYPRANQKRPIVLIGPPNIGRHELRQRLMEDADRFAAAIPHTSRARKDTEVDGQDYHFISRAQFEADIVSRRFVEHGEYERAYYGTSLDAIRAVVNAGRICVLNLHPQSLRILRSSDLKPYVVFVAPPSLEKLRQKKARNGEAFKEEELKETIEKAREMEERFGHLFDMVIINNDTERAFRQLLEEVNALEREPQWVPVHWVKAP